MGAESVYKASRWKAFFLVLICLLFVLAAAGMYGKRPVVASLGMLLFGAGMESAVPMSKVDFATL
jgi:hypothetical protein